MGHGFYFSFLKRNMIRYSGWDMMHWYDLEWVWPIIGLQFLQSHYFFLFKLFVFIWHVFFNTLNNRFTVVLKLQTSVCYLTDKYFFTTIGMIDNHIFTNNGMIVSFHTFLSIIYTCD